MKILFGVLFAMCACLALTAWSIACSKSVDDTPANYQNIGNASKSKVSSSTNIPNESVSEQRKLGIVYKRVGCLDYIL